MNFLLDTHTLVWFLNGDKSLSSKAKKIIENNDIGNYVSIVTIWEIAIKVNLNRLDLKNPLSNIVEDLDNNNFKLLQINIEDILILSALPLIHKDPFDRLLISQAFNNNFTLISKDSYFQDYDIKLLW